MRQSKSMVYKAGQQRLLLFEQNVTCAAKTVANRR
jgi:hypothetical protein